MRTNNIKSITIDFKEPVKVIVTDGKKIAWEMQNVVLISQQDELVTFCDINYDTKNVYKHFGWDYHVVDWD